MSLTYSDLTFTQYPDACDTYEYMHDMTFELLGLVSQYESLMINKRFDEANKLLKDNPQLDRIYFNAEKYNKIVDSVKAIQRHYFSDIQKYLEQLVTFKGNYISTSSYKKYDVVLYNSSAYLCVSDSGIGMLPTSDKWIQITLQGEQGVPGISLAYCGTWDSTDMYNKDNAVVYNNVLYASKIDNNISKTPSNTSEYWSKIFDLSMATVFDNSSVGITNQTTMQGALEELYSITNNNKTSINNNMNSINTINTKLNTIESGAQKNTVTGVKGSNESSYRTGNINITKANIGLGNVDNVADANKSVKFATSAGTCTGNSATATNANYANSAGNSDTVDGFHFQLSTTELTPGSSALTTNVFYFVYE